MRFSVIGSLEPGEDLHSRTNEFEAASHAVDLPGGIEIEISYPAWRDHPLGGWPSDVDPTLAPNTQLHLAIQKFDAERGDINGAPYWSENP